MINKKIIRLLYNFFYYPYHIYRIVWHVPEPTFMWLCMGLVCWSYAPKIGKNKIRNLIKYSL